jgi:hypothetical protein
MPSPPSSQRFLRLAQPLKPQETSHEMSAPASSDSTVSSRRHESAQ